MFIKDIQNCEEVDSGDHTKIVEIYNPLNDKDLDLKHSLAICRVLPNKTSGTHRLKSNETYYILAGNGVMYIDDEAREVHAGNAIYIPAMSIQKIKNTEDRDLVIACIVEPAWEKENEEILD